MSALGRSALVALLLSAALVPAWADEPEQALEWLRADLEALEKRFAENPSAVARALVRWKSTSDLASVRDADDLSSEWRELWSDVDALLARARDA